MDILLFCVALGFLVEATRATICKYCVGKDNGSKSLEEPLLKPHVLVDELGYCRLPCCGPILVNGVKDYYEGFEDYFLETSEEESLDSLERLRTTTDDSEEDLEEHEGKTVEWEDLLNNVTVTLVGDRGRSLKGKEIVEEEDEIKPESDPTRSHMLPSRPRKPSRGRNSAKVYPEPLDPPRSSIQAPHYESINLGQSSDAYALKIIDQSAWGCNFKSDVKVVVFTGESSKS